ncbi:MAG: transporter permease [Myxococcaceae bacterium]|nr:transporter permease [Myxococcaceae bacterium]
MEGVRNYALVTAAYWAFTLTDGALRMLVLLHFHALGYSPVQLAFLFLLYEFFGVVTNLVGGWIAAQMGLRVTLLGGLALQVVALGMLSLLDPHWARGASVAYVMAAQGYGVIQSVAPALIGRWTGGRAPQGPAAQVLALLLAATMAVVALGLGAGVAPNIVILGGLAAFGVVFAVNSSVHSYLILAYADGDKVAMNVGFYYMANAGGRLVGTLLSGLLYQHAGLAGCLWASVAFALAAGGLSLLLPQKNTTLRLTEMKAEGSSD